MSPSKLPSTSPASFKVEDMASTDGEPHPAPLVCLAIMMGEAGAGVLNLLSSTPNGGRVCTCGAHPLKGRQRRGGPFDENPAAMARRAREQQARVPWLGTVRWYARWRATAVMMQRGLSSSLFSLLFSHQQSHVYAAATHLMYNGGLR